MNETRLQQLCARISQRFSVLAIPARIMNHRRWEALADSAPADFPISPPHRIRVSDSFGVVCYDWPRLTPEEQKAVLEMCEKPMPETVSV